MRDDVGIRATDLGDEDLLREVTHLHDTRHNTFLHGTPAALVNHTARMLELEEEFARRYPAQDGSDEISVHETHRLLADLDATS